MSDRSIKTILLHFSYLLLLLAFINCAQDEPRKKGNKVVIDDGDALKDGGGSSGIEPMQDGSNSGGFVDEAEPVTSGDGGTTDGGSSSTDGTGSSSGDGTGTSTDGGMDDGGMDDGGSSASSGSGGDSTTGGSDGNDPDLGNLESISWGSFQELAETGQMYKLMGARKYQAYSNFRDKNNVQVQVLIINNKVYINRSDDSGGFKLDANNVLTTVGSGDIQGYNAFIDKDGNIRHVLIRGNKVYERINSSGSFQEVASNNPVRTTGSGDYKAYTAVLIPYGSGLKKTVITFVRGNKIYERDSSASNPVFKEMNLHPMLDGSYGGEVQALDTYNHPDGYLLQALIRGSKVFTRKYQNGSWTTFVPVSEITNGIYQTFGEGRGNFQAFDETQIGDEIKQAVIRGNRVFTRSRKTNENWGEFASLRNDNAIYTQTGSGDFQGYYSYVHPTNHKIYQFVIRNNKWYTRKRSPSEDWPAFTLLGDTQAVYKIGSGDFSGASGYNSNVSDLIKTYVIRGQKIYSREWLNGTGSAFTEIKSGPMLNATGSGSFNAISTNQFEDGSFKQVIIRNNKIYYRESN